MRATLVDWLHLAITRLEMLLTVEYRPKKPVQIIIIENPIVRVFIHLVVHHLSKNYQKWWFTMVLDLTGALFGLIHCICREDRLISILSVGKKFQKAGAVSSSNSRLLDVLRPTSGGRHGNFVTSSTA